MAGVRDPAFWKRFSMAVHLDEEKGNFPDNQSISTGSSRRPLRPSDTWLERNRKKQRRTRICGCVIALLFLLLIAGIVFAVMFLLKVGLFAPAKTTTSTSTPVPTGSSSLTGAR